ncbi:MAG: alanine--tRNA ligase [Rickettsiales bacterium]|nr:alanine--tRNA ligase [Rickettsiales bacterium]
MKTTFDIRSEFLRFFERNGHEIYSSSPLIPRKDPSLMFTNAGMVQFKDIFLGKEDPKDTRVVTSQKCVRAGGKHNDLENVGYTRRHLTFFEMLGNFSFGDYFKEKAIFYAWTFLTKELKLDINRLYITVYHDDDEAFKLWRKLTGFEEKRIIRIKTKDNFWMMGDTGPCGPCSEIFYDQGDHFKGGLPGTKDQDGDRFVEVWNLVFMQYEQIAANKMQNLKKQSIDTGMGLERIAAIVQEVYDNFEIDVFKTIINASEEISSTKAQGSFKVSHRIIADHLRSSAFLIAEGIMPSNEGRGYVLRRILRRAIRHISKLGCKDLMLKKLFPSLIEEMGSAYPELEKQQDFITSVLSSEEESFKATIESGLKLLNNEVVKVKSDKLFPGKVAFKLHDTYGFPIDLTMDILKERNIHIDLVEFDQCMKQQKQMAREAWVGSGEKTTEKLWFDIKTKISDVDFVGYDSLEIGGIVKALIQDRQQVSNIKNTEEFFLITNQTPFFGESGGQAGDIGKISKEDGTNILVLDTIIPIANLYVHKCKLKTGDVKLNDVVKLSVDKQHRDDVKRNHTATHLLHATLRKKLGKNVVQKGSSVIHSRFRFDFSYPKAISREILDEIEREINLLILDNLEVKTKIMSYEESIKKDTMALFGEKYEKDVRVVYVGEDEKNLSKYSAELCGGTHVSRLGDIGVIRILSETAIAAGIRRIEAVTGRFAVKHIQKTSNELQVITELVQAEHGKTAERIENLLSEQKKMLKELSNLKQKELIEQLKNVPLENIGDVQLISFDATKFEPSSMRSSVQQFLHNESKSLMVLLFRVSGGKLFCLVAISSSLAERIGADKVYKCLMETFGAKGGGNRFMAQGSVDYTSGLQSRVKSKIKEILADSK